MDHEGFTKFLEKAWWALVRHHLSPTNGDNILSPNRATLVPKIMKGYEIDIAKIIAREIHDWVVSTETILTFPCLLMQQLCLDEGVL